MASKFCKVKIPIDNDKDFLVDVEILYWGSSIFQDVDENGNIRATFSHTQVFCREIKSGAVIGVYPQQLQFDTEP